MTTSQKETFCKVWLTFDHRARIWRQNLDSSLVPGTTVAAELDEALRGLAEAAGFNFEDEEEVAP